MMKEPALSRDFYSSAHCRTGVHCPACRARHNGRSWREGVSKAYGMPVRDFECPSDLPWLEDQFEAPSALRPYMFRALQLSCKTPAARLLRGFTMQLCGLAAGGRVASCGSQTALIRRLQSKLDYYWRTYSQTS